MVNVNQPLPFNLHNRRSYGRQDRSVSVNTKSPRPTSSASPSNPSPGSPFGPGYPTHPNIPSYTPSRDPSPSIQTSHSTSSLHPGDASYLPPEADPDGGTRRPILNVRLVRGSGMFIPGGRARQGRSATRGRLGRFGEDRGWSTEDGNGKSKRVENGGDSIEVESPSTAGENSQVRSVALPAHLQGGEQVDRSSNAAPDRRPPFLATEFKIEDIGNLSQSWGE